jgi:hypothetical protein
MYQLHKEIAILAGKARLLEENGLPENRGRIGPVIVSVSFSAPATDSLPTLGVTSPMSVWPVLLGRQRGQPTIRSHPGRYRCRSVAIALDGASGVEAA